MAALSLQINLETHPEHVAIEMDCQHAFGNGKRKILLRETMRHAPWIFGYVKTFYSSAAMLRVARQTIKEEDRFVWPKEGTQQGCPQGMAMFCSDMALVLEGA